MSLNIKNEETCNLARELADLTGETMTGAITVALRERLEREQRQRSVEARRTAIHAIQDRVARLLKDGPPTRRPRRAFIRRTRPAEVIVDASAVRALYGRHCDPDSTSKDVR